MKTFKLPIHHLFTVMVCCITGLFFTSYAKADSGINHATQHFSSPAGAFVFRILPNPTGRDSALGAMIAVMDHGKEREMWRKPLSVVPDCRCFISDRTQQVIGITSSGYGSKLVLYTRDGEVQKVFEVADLIAPAEASRHIGRDATVRFWWHDATFGFTELGTQFVIITKWGTKIAIDLATGTVTTNSAPVN